MAGEGCMEELLTVQTRVWNDAMAYIRSMSLMVAVQLGIPDAVHSHGGSISLTLLASALRIPESKVPALRRLMRALAHSGVFHRDVKLGEEGKEAEEEVYSPTLFSGQLVKDNPTTAAQFLLLMVYPPTVAPWYSMAAWFLAGGRDTAADFEAGKGWTISSSPGRVAEYNDLFNSAMASDSRWSVAQVVREHPEVFRGMASVVDVGGGIGTAAKAIKEAFPEMRCTVLELSHVVAAAPAIDGVDFVEGDVFQHVPPADAVLLKWLLHGFNDEDCVKILRRCKEAILAARKHGGKVIIIEVVASDGSDDPEMVEAKHLMDLSMLATKGGEERDEAGWRRIIAAAGFSGCRFTRALGLRSVIEAYP